MPEQTPSAEPTPSCYLPYGASGGGGNGGGYVFTDLAHLDHIITRWTTLRDDIAADGQDIHQATRQIVPPADDEPSVTQAKAARASLIKGQQHNQAMVDYADGYITKLAAARARYATTEENNVDRLRNLDSDR
jgi:hypothetical protein